MKSPTKNGVVFLLSFFFPAKYVVNFNLKPVFQRGDSKKGPLSILALFKQKKIIN
jgi:hypothetical protein